MKRGLVLEGGAMRGMFTAGVLDVMLEQGLRYDGIIGVSAGAAFGCNYKSRQPGRVIRYNLRFCRDPRYASLRSLIRTGDLFGADFCYRAIPEELDPFDVETFRADPTEFWVVCTDVDTGEPVYHLCPRGDREDLEWFRASASMPIASRVVEIGGQRLLDGGIADSIPIRRFREMGYDRCVVVLTQPRDYRKHPNKALPLIRLGLGKYPKVLEAMARRHTVYNETVEVLRELERRGEIFVLRPEHDLGVSRVEHDPKKLQAAYDHGRAVGEKRLTLLEAFLQG